MASGVRTLCEQITSLCRQEPQISATALRLLRVTLTTLTDLNSGLKGDLNGRKRRGPRQRGAAAAPLESPAERHPSEARRRPAERAREWAAAPPHGIVAQDAGWYPDEVAVVPTPASARAAQHLPPIQPGGAVGADAAEVEALQKETEQLQQELTYLRQVRQLEQKTPVSARDPYAGVQQQNPYAQPSPPQHPPDPYAHPSAHNPSPARAHNGPPPDPYAQPSARGYPSPGRPHNPAQLPPLPVPGYTPSAPGPQRPVHHHHRHAVQLAHMPQPNGGAWPPAADPQAAPVPSGRRGFLGHLHELRGGPSQQERDEKERKHREWLAELDVQIKERQHRRQQERQKEEELQARDEMRLRMAQQAHAQQQQAQQVYREQQRHIIAT